MNTGTSASPKPSKWHLAPFLTILDTVPQERNTTSNIYDTDNNGDSASDEQEINITQDNILRSSPVTKNEKVTELLDKRSKERTDLMTQLIAKKNTDDSPYSNELTPYSYGPPSLDSPSYSNIQQQFGPANPTTFTPF
ncbi:hypothetical protein QTP88_028659 [Uroleucon formosanum]